MTGRWLTLFLGVALLQGTLSFGPIDDTDEEFIAYRNLIFETSDGYRLPDNVIPSHYTVHLTPHLAEGVNQFTFDGNVTINIAVNTPTAQIILHCSSITIDPTSVRVETATGDEVVVTPNQDFTCDERFSTFKIDTDSALIPGSQYAISMLFVGSLQTNMRGFYRSWYIDASGTRRWMATTQFQPSHARQAFPCFDEPRFKATFDISITRDVEGFSETISNMPFRDATPPVNGKITENFHTTPPTSTYLLAFIVSDYGIVATNGNSARPFNIYARRNIGNTGEYSLAVGEPLLREMEDYTEYNYYELFHAVNLDTTIPYQMNMKQAAIPDFSAGAMENWGLLTYREALILNDPENTNNFYKQRIANIISHEIAHMWFGNLVTCAWWDNLWLNEGFARFYQYFLTHKVEPDMGFENRFITEQVHLALLSDAADNAHPLTDPKVLNTTSVSAHFSTITYAKGAAVLRMTQHLLGDDIYKTALVNYLRTNAFGVVQPADLFAALQAVTVGTDFNTLYDGVTVAQYFESWSEQPGHPLLQVDVDRDSGVITLTQSRFDRDARVAPPTVTPTPTEEGDAPLWHIPITWTRADSPDFDSLKPSSILRIASTTITLPDIGNEWVIFNIQQTGFYRVNYDPHTWLLITRALRSSDRTNIHEYNRAQIVDDVFLLARNGKITYREALNILSFLEFEDQYAPWHAAITGFNFALRRLAHDSLAQARLRTEIIRLSAAVVSRLGFNETEATPAHQSEKFMDDLFRMNLGTFLCNVGHQVCIDTAKRSFQQWRNDGVSIPPNMRPWVYCNGLRYGSTEDYDFFWEKYLTENLANEQVVMLGAAGCTQHQPALNRFLANIAPGTIENYIVRAQDYSTAISSAVTSNEYNSIRVFQWLQSNLEDAKTTGVVNTILSSVTSRLLTHMDIALVQNWVTENSDNLGPTAYATANSGLAVARDNIQFYLDTVPEFQEYFEVGFEDPTGPTTPAPTTTTTESTSTSTTTSTTSTPIADTTTTEPPPASTEPTTTSSTAATTPETTTPSPDSASIASLSIVTLIVTLIVNMA